MAAKRIINVDLAKVYDAPKEGNHISTLAWGDEVEVKETKPEHVEIEFTFFRTLPNGSIIPCTVPGFLRPGRSPKIPTSDITIPKSQNRVMKVDFVDVQQGDGSVIETPKGKVVLVDGGDNQLFARYLANRFRRNTPQNVKEIDCIVVTHGDADHFAGLTEIHESETNQTETKRLFIHPQRVYHNGLVKRPSKVKESEALGRTTVVGPDTFITGLETDLLTVPDTEMNRPFLEWKKALKAFRTRGPIQFRRLSLGDDDAFDFLDDENIGVQVLGPIVNKVNGVDGLKFLGEPPKGPRVGHESLGLERISRGKSVSHTINGHSVILRFTYGQFHFLFTGDLNDEAGRILTQAHNEGTISLRSEVFKVPHHGSADFSGAFIQAVAPMVSVVSSGDENARKEYIHPRATIMGALGRHSRVLEPLIFVTELVAFFQTEGFYQRKTETQPAEDPVAVNLCDPGVALDRPKSFFAFSRAAFGIVKIRTNGNRLMVYTNSGQADLKEAYAYTMDNAGNPVPEVVRQV